MAFVHAGMRGKRTNTEPMMLYTSPAVVSAMIAIAMRRNWVGVIALLFALLAVVGWVLAVGL